MTAVLEALEEDEAYLFALLTDPSGLDQAEFLWEDATNLEDGLFRAFPFQHRWWRSQAPRQIDSAARAIGKSLSIQARACAFPFVHPGQEMLITAPEANHLEAVTDVIETRILAVPLLRAMLEKKRAGIAITHKPFKINFSGNSRIIGRIPHRDGSNVKGSHPIWLELDEAQDYPSAGWIELIETLKRQPGATWRAHGVTRGVRDWFHKLTDPESQEGRGWTRHRIMRMSFPLWSDEERQEKIEMYGGYSDPEYRRNILGEPGDEMSPVFVLSRLMQGVDDNKESDYNRNEYFLFKMSESNEGTMPEFPVSHKAYNRIWCGCDLGFTVDPSEILVYAEHVVSDAEKKELKAYKKATPKDGASRLKLITRIQMKRVSAPTQAEVIKSVVDFYRPMAFAMDRNGVGLPLLQFLSGYDVTGYSDSEKVLVELSPELMELEFDEQVKRGIRKVPADYGTDVLRRLVDTGRLWLPWDLELLKEFQGQTMKNREGTRTNVYGRSYSKGAHTLYASRYAAVAYGQHELNLLIEANKPKKKRTPVYFGL